MEKQACSSCLKPKATLVCGLCQAPVCKACAHLYDDESFSFLPERPAELKHSTYCEACYQAHVAEAERHYDEVMELAKEVLVFTKSQGKESRLIPRKAPPVRVSECADEQETLLRLAFLAALGGYNALVDVELLPKKVRNHAYQSTAWTGVGIPARIDSDRYARRVDPGNPN